ncbi:hypothetical protein Vadar_021312 [Vaccinium darrowii]|uniref:Uncharacterized protein n=1 Tax=Vaccinium darrowii TaxID=229202 RepID=A0ACB7XK75_9ERIC|nr:hypothetical protein Vadar_021312 [Vaccinium darrowii]
MVNWAELNQDLLSLIGKKLDFREDFNAFGRVCKSWRSVAVKENFRGSQQIPWLMLAEAEEEEKGDKNNSATADERRFVSVKGGDMIGKLMLPEARGKRCLETRGWLVTISENSEMNLLHPISRVQIALPSMTTLDHYEDGSMFNNFIYVQKAVLSSCPSGSNNYVLMIIHEGRGFLGYWRCGDKAWTTIQTRFGAFRDITYYKGQFYAVNTSGKVFVCDIERDPTRAHAVGGAPDEIVPWIQTERHPYIVEWEGNLLIVVRDGFMLKYVGSMAWNPSKGDNALFLGDNASISVRAAALLGIKPNCIYYTDDCWPAYIEFKRGGGRDMGIYNLADGSQTPYFKGESFSSICPPLWVRPYF